MNDCIEYLGTGDGVCDVVVWFFPSYNSLEMIDNFLAQSLKKKDGGVKS
jgi:hypothetical protein